MICNLDVAIQWKVPFLFVYIYLVALESSVLGGKFFSGKTRKNYKIREDNIHVKAHGAEILS